MSFISVSEAAEVLRSHPNTIYKMCRSGKLPAIKVGREWRIDKSQLDEYVKGRIVESEDISFEGLTTLISANGHYLGVFTEKDSLEKFESSFLFKASQNESRSLFKGCWWQHPDDARQYLTAGGLDVKGLESKGRLVVKSLSKEFEKSDLVGAASLWLKATTDALRAGYDGLVGCGSPSFDCCGTFPQLLEFEESLDTMLKGQPVSGVCSYHLNLGRPNAIARVLDLISLHDRFFMHSKEKFILAQPCLLG
jgi:excisionase family DNA binding protein